MKKLHLVGFTAESDGLILSARKGAKSGSFIVPLDETLVSAIELARRRRDGELDTGEGGIAAAAASPAKPRSALSPREIQARLRAGATVAEVAAQAGADDEWVLRFAAPILAEQAKVIESAQRLTMAKTRRGPSIEALAPSVQWNLSDRGVRMSGDVFADCWSAYNLHGARWAVRFAYTSRKRHQVAEWEVDLRERSLLARNRLASDLGHVEPGRRRPTSEELEAPSEPATAGAPPPPAPSPSLPAAPRPAAVRRSPVRPQPAPAATKRTAKAAPKGASKAAAKASTGAASKAAARTSAARRGGPAAPTAAAAKKAAGARRTSSAKATAPATTPARPATQPGAKRSPRQPAARKAAPSRKKPGEAPGGSARKSRGQKAEPATEAEDRPSHLGRPPSPMKFANRATSLPLRRAPSPYERPRPAPAPPRPRAEAPPPTPEPPPEPATAPERANPANPRFEPGPEPDFTDPAAAAAAASRGRIRTGSEVGRRPKATRSDNVEVPRPAVVILSTPGAEPQPVAPASIEDQERQARLASAERLRAALSEPPERLVEPEPEPAPSIVEAPSGRQRRGRRQAFST